MKYRFILYLIILIASVCSQNIYAQKSWINISELRQDNQWAFINDMIERPSDSCPYYWVTVSWENSSDLAKRDITPRKIIKVLEYTTDFKQCRVIESSDYNSKNIRIRTEKLTGQLSPIVQGSPEEVIAKEAQEIIYKQDNNIEEPVTDIIIVEDK